MWTKTADRRESITTLTPAMKPWVGSYTGKDPMDNVYTKNL